MDSDLDTYKTRRGKRGQYGIDWFRYRDGVPPEDDDADYEWTGSQWSKIWECEE